VDVADAGEVDLEAGPAAAPVMMSTGWSAGIVTPWNALAAREKRPWYCDGAFHRSTSSTALPARLGSAASLSRSPGCSANVITPLPTSLVTVSAPAVVSRVTNRATSSSSSRSIAPSSRSTSAASRCPIMSSEGWARLSRTRART